MKSFEIISKIVENLGGNSYRVVNKPKDNAIFWAEIPNRSTIIYVIDNYANTSLDVIIEDDVFQFEAGLGRDVHEAILDQVIKKIKEYSR